MAPDVNYLGARKESLQKSDEDVVIEAYCI
jgi:hypothetical protein